jgi:predicted amidohydrolase
MPTARQKINISIAQVNTILGDIDKNLETHYRLIGQAIDHKSDLIFFPELSLTGYSLKDAVYDVALPADDQKLDKLKKMSGRINILVGAVELSERFEIFNSLYFYEKGELLFKHRKVYLPTYGLFEEKRYFSAGSRFRAFNSRMGRMGLMICEDLWHATSGIILAQDGASVLFACAAGIARGLDADILPENVRVWETLIKALAINTTSYVVFANRVGVEDGLMFFGGSEVIDPHGHRLGKAKYFEEDMINVDVDMLKLKHARINTTLLSDENLPVVIDELARIRETRKEY